MNKLMFVIALAVAGCGGSSNSSPPDAPPQQPDAAAGLQCFAGTPTTHDQLINACVDSSVTVIHKAPMLPLLNSDGSLPQLP
jgi:hypothetical protein